MTTNEAINAWMRGNGWRWSQGGYWVKDGLKKDDFLLASQDLAAEMWRMSEGRVAEAKITILNRLERRISDFGISYTTAIENERRKIIRLAHQPTETKDND